MPGLKIAMEIEARSENRCGKWHFSLVWNRVRIWRTGRHQALPRIPGSTSSGKGKGAHEPKGPNVRSLSWLACLGVCYSPPLDGMLVHRLVTPLAVCHWYPFILFIPAWVKPGTKWQYAKITLPERSLVNIHQRNTRRLWTTLPLVTWLMPISFALRIFWKICDVKASRI